MFQKMWAFFSDAYFGLYKCHTFHLNHSLEKQNKCVWLCLYLWMSLHTFPVHMHLWLKSLMASFSSNKHLSQTHAHWPVDSAASESHLFCLNPFAPSISLYLNMITKLKGLNSSIDNSISKLSVIYWEQRHLLGTLFDYIRSFNPRLLYSECILTCM